MPKRVFIYTGVSDYSSGNSSVFSWHYLFSIFYYLPSRICCTLFWDAPIWPVFLCGKYPQQPTLHESSRSRRAEFMVRTIRNRSRTPQNIFLSTQRMLRYKRFAVDDGNNDISPCQCYFISRPQERGGGKIIYEKHNHLECFANNRVS